MADAHDLTRVVYTQIVSTMRVVQISPEVVTVDMPLHDADGLALCLAVRSTIADDRIIYRVSDQRSSAAAAAVYPEKVDIPGYFSRWGQKDEKALQALVDQTEFMRARTDVEIDTVTGEIYDECTIEHLGAAISAVASVVAPIWCR